MVDIHIYNQYYVKERCYKSHKTAKSMLAYKHYTYQGKNSIESFIAIDGFNDNVVRATPDMTIEILSAYYTCKSGIIQGLSQKKIVTALAIIWEILLLLQSTMRCAGEPLVPSLGLPLMHHYFFLKFVTKWLNYCSKTFLK